MAHSFTNLLAHVIFSTKDRQPFIDGEMGPRLFSYMGGIVRKLDAYPLLINGPVDHVHMLVGMPATLSVADFLRLVKTNSSSWVHKEWRSRRSFAWQIGYGAFSVSQSAQENVEAYIRRQEEHHKKVTFQEEFLAFLKRHKIEYDERYIWE